MRPWGFLKREGFFAPASQVAEGVQTQLAPGVVATTHSSDCYWSLAAIVEAETTTRPEVTIQRIERGQTHAVAFTDDEIALAAKTGAEVR